MTGDPISLWRRTEPTCPGSPGEKNIHLVGAISRSSIRYVPTRHEQGAPFMAEPYGRCPDGPGHR